MELTASFRNLGELKDALTALQAVPDGAGVQFTKRGEVHTIHADTRHDPTDEAKRPEGD